MTEQEWLTFGSTEKQANDLLEFLRPDENARKTRLFKCACCRHLWRLLTDERSREGVLLAERRADGETSDMAYEEAVASTRAVWRKKEFWQEHENRFVPYMFRSAAEVARDTTANRGFTALGIARMTFRALGAEAEAVAKSSPDIDAGRAAVRAAYQRMFMVQASYIRDIFANPFRPVSLSPLWLAWNDGAVRKMSQAIYDERAFDRLPLLADALEDAGCTSGDILAHCRGPGPHVRGCWAVDLLLGKK